MKKSTLVFIEVGMFLGIAVAFFTVPRNTPFETFLACSGAIIVTGNTFLAWVAMRKRDQQNPHREEFWQLAPKVFLQFAVIWVLLTLLTMLIRSH